MVEAVRGALDSCKWPALSAFWGAMNEGKGQDFVDTLVDIIVDERLGMDGIGKVMANFENTLCKDHPPGPG